MIVQKSQNRERFFLAEFTAKLTNFRKVKSVFFHDESKQTNQSPNTGFYLINLNNLLTWYNPLKPPVLTMDCTASTKPLYAGNFPLPSLTNNINENIQIKNEAVTLNVLK